MMQKENGKFRPLGIPTIRDRVVEMACKLVIEPIFEADFEDCSYGFRPKRSAAGAMRAIKSNLKEGKTEVYDADVASYFDTIPHDKLMKTISLRISDPHVLHLIKLWLKAPMEVDGQLRGGKKNKVGTPQGGVISPLLSNIYLHLLDRIVNKAGSVYKTFGVKIVRYADDFVLMGRTIPEEVRAKTQTILERMGLKLNDVKTKQLDAQEKPFEFLGFQIRYDKDIHGQAKRYWNIVPSPKSCKRIRMKITTHLKKKGHFGAEALVKGLNPILRGWINYYSIQGVSYPTMAKKNLRWYMFDRLYRFYRRKSQRHDALYCHRVFETLVKKHGLIDPYTYRSA